MAISTEIFQGKYFHHKTLVLTQVQEYHYGPEELIKQAKVQC